MFRTAQRRQREESIERLYGAIVTQSRQPVFYRELRVPDTIEGRFDLLVLHLHLVYRRLAEADDAARAVGQGVFDFFVADMDASLRELGVGDLSVPKRMRSLGEAFYGRAAAYDAALTQAGNEGLAEALIRNVYSSDTGANTAAGMLAAYVRGSVDSLAQQDRNEIARGVVRFPQPLAAETEHAR